MRFETFDVGGVTVAELVEGEIASERDAIDLVGSASFQGADVVLVESHKLAPDFFDLSTGLAGAALQKFSNYRLRLVIAGEFEGHGSESLQAFIRESNRGGNVAFVADRETALARIAQQG
ncbi:MAG TPA: DUF4180 domain-containing protein [Trueperaceae bacterium]|nr:DUF4180 domain-containing protein [Trueperaceae bacterium]